MRTIPNSKPRQSFASKFFIGSVLFFVVGCVVAAYFFFGGGNVVSPQNIDLQVVAPSLVGGGTEAQLQILVTNRNSSQLQLADLVLTYPDGTRDPKNPQKSLTNERQSVGSIAPGQQFKRTASAIFYGQEGAQENVHVALEYSVPGSNAVFVREGDVTITIGSSPVSVSIAAPGEATAGQPFTIDVTVQSNASAPVDNVVVEGRYPFGYSVASADPKPAFGGSLWRMGTMAPGSSQTIHVTGTLLGQDGDQRVFRFLAGSDSDMTNTKIKVPFLSIPATVTVARPFISGAISISGNSGSTVAADPGKIVQGSIVWKNNLPDAIENVEVSLELTGPVLDRSSIESSNGFYQSSDSRLVWTSAQEPRLAQVPPGGGGTLNFSFASVEPGGGGTLYTNPKVSLKLSVKGVRQGQGGQEVSSADQTDVVFASAVDLLVQSLYATGAYANAGPVPPRAETPTSYTVAWTVKSSSNAVGNASISTVLPPYVNYKTGSAGIAYDAASRTVRWDLGDVAAGAGYTSAARSESFQVTLNPSTSQVGQIPALTGAAVFSGQDRFAQVSIQANAPAVTTATADGAGGAVQAK